MDIRYPFILMAAANLLTACSHNQGISADESLTGFDDPLKFVQWIYELPNPRFMIFEDGRMRPHYYTKRLVQLTAGRERCYKEEFHMDWLDFNYIVPGNDYEIKNLCIKELWQEGDMAKILVMFENLGEKQRLEYLLRRGNASWMIDDIFTERASLSRDLSLWCADGAN